MHSSWTQHVHLTKSLKHKKSAVWMKTLWAVSQRHLFRKSAYFCCSLNDKILSTSLVKYLVHTGIQNHVVISYSIFISQITGKHAISCSISLLRHQITSIAQNSLYASVTVIVFPSVLTVLTIKPHQQWLLLTCWIPIHLTISTWHTTKLYCFYKHSPNLAIVNTVYYPKHHSLSDFSFLIFS